MKKLLVLLMVMVLALSAAVSASAAECDLTKEWVDKEGNTLKDGQYPDIDIEFEISGKSAEEYSYAGYATEGNIPDITLVKSAGSDKFVIGGTDAISGIGIFKYTAKEKANPVSGVVYDDSSYLVTIVRGYAEDETTGKTGNTIEDLQVSVAKASSPSDKLTTITNTYKVRDISIDKTVTGNLSYKEDKFKVIVYFESDKPVYTDIVMPDDTHVKLNAQNEGNMYISDEYEIEISDNDGQKTINGVPVGVTVHIKEEDYEPYTLDGYTLDEGELTEEEELTFVMGESDAKVVITNSYGTNIDTGITLESLPYILILAAVGGAAVFWFVRKRRSAADAE